MSTAAMHEAIYKGATRPAMKWGVPLVALVGVFMPAIVAGVWLTLYVTTWSALVVAAVLVPAFVGMRHLTARDDQRLRQTWLALRLWLACRNAGLWGVRSYAPFRTRWSHDARRT